MRRIAALALSAALSLAPAASAQKKDAPPTPAELAEIAARGRLLAAYDAAAWHSTDALAALAPPPGSVEGYVGRKTASGWTVVYGRLDAKREKYLIAYEAAEGAAPTEFKVKRHEPPAEDRGFYLFAARAVETALEAFSGDRQRPYNVAVLPAPADRFYVYVLPAQTREGVYPHGGDARFLVSADGLKLVEQRRMHRSVIDFEVSPRMAAGFHTAIQDNVPEDSDVFYVLSRKPSVPEYVLTEKFAYRVETDGSIKYLGTSEEFRKRPPAELNR